MATNRSINQADKKDHVLNLPKKNISATIDPSIFGLFAQTTAVAEYAVACLRLLVTAVEAEPDAYKQEETTALTAIAILKKYPDLLFRKGRVIDHFGRKILASPYQLLLGAGDIWALKHVCEEVLADIEDGEATAKDQFQEQFPNCSWPFDPDMGEEALYDERNKAQIAQVIDQLKTIVEKISVDPCTNGFATLNETTDAVAALCKIFAPKIGEVINTGLYFPLGIMREIFRVYNAQFNPWSGAQLAFFSREVIGAAEAALTAVDGQCCKNGVSKLNMEKGPNRQDGLFCPCPEGIPAKWLPINNKLGHEMFVDPYDGSTCFVASNPWYFEWCGRDGVGRSVPAVVPGRGLSIVEQLMENKSREMWKLLIDHTKRSQHSVSRGVTNQ